MQSVISWLRAKRDEATHQPDSVRL